VTTAGKVTDTQSARKALHLVAAERRPVFEHRQLVPLQRRVSNYIGDHVRQ
jgi:hypothetical protein